MYDLEQTKALVKAAVERTPNRRNPKGEFQNCEYTSKGGRAHCIAGQAMKDVGIDPPAYGHTTPFGELWHESALNRDTRDALRDMFTLDALVWLGEAQMAFDNAGTPLPWKKAWEKLNAA